MKKLILGLAALSLLVSCNDTKTAATLDTKEDSLSYSIGINIAGSLKTQGLDTVLNANAISLALEDAFKKDSSELISAEEATKILQTYFEAKQKEQQAAAEAEGAKAAEAGEAFLAQNKEREGVQVTASGLQYEIINEGSGDVPTAENAVKVHYHGTLIDGTVFDSSVDRGEPAQFGVSQVIAGWTEALQLMPVGSKWKLFIPQNLAYGPRGAGQMIPPYSALVFEVELLDIVQ